MVYVDWKINWVDINSDITRLVDNCFNVIVLSFWMDTRGLVDAGLTFSQQSVQKRQEAIQYAEARGAKIIISAGGATEHVEHFFKGSVAQSTAHGTDYGTRAAQAANDLGLHGVDFDLELSPGNNGPFHSGHMQAFCVAASAAARATLQKW